MQEPTVRKVGPGIRLNGPPTVLSVWPADICRAMNIPDDLSAGEWIEIVEAVLASYGHTKAIVDVVSDELVFEESLCEEESHVG